MYTIYALDSLTCVNWLLISWIIWMIITFKMDHINDNDKTYEKCEYCNKNLNKLGINDANRAYKNRQYKTHIIFNKPFKSIQINN